MSPFLNCRISTDVNAPWTLAQLTPCLPLFCLFFFFLYIPECPPYTIHPFNLNDRLQYRSLASYIHLISQWLSRRLIKLEICRGERRWTTTETLSTRRYIQFCPHLGHISSRRRSSILLVDWLIFILCFLYAFSPLDGLSAKCFFFRTM